MIVYSAFAGCPLAASQHKALLSGCLLAELAWSISRFYLLYLGDCMALED